MLNVPNLQIWTSPPPRMQVGVFICSHASMALETKEVDGPFEEVHSRGGLPVGPILNVPYILFLTVTGAEWFRGATFDDL